MALSTLLSILVSLALSVGLHRVGTFFLFFFVYWRKNNHKMEGGDIGACISGDHGNSRISEKLRLWIRVVPLFTLWARLRSIFIITLPGTFFWSAHFSDRYFRTYTRTVNYWKYSISTSWVWFSGWVPFSDIFKLNLFSASLQEKLF